MGDLMMQAGKEIELPIARIAPEGACRRHSRWWLPTASVHQYHHGCDQSQLPGHEWYSVSSRWSTRASSSMLRAPISWSDEAICSSRKAVRQRVCSVFSSIRPKWKRIVSHLQPAGLFDAMLYPCRNMCLIPIIRQRLALLILRARSALWGCARLIDHPSSKVPHRLSNVSLPSVIIVPDDLWTSWKQLALSDRSSNKATARCFFRTDTAWNPAAQHIGNMKRYSRILIVFPFPVQHLYGCILRRTLRLFFGEGGHCLS